VPKRELIESVDQLPRSTIAAHVVRHIAPGYLPLSGEGARVHGGRWNPPDSFAVLYTASDRDAMVSELDRAARRQGLRAIDLLPRDEVIYTVELQRVLDLTDALSLERVGLDDALLSAADWSPCQAIGDAARYVGFEAVLAPSATGSGQTLAIFLDRLLRGSIVEVSSVTPLELDF
jgi:RES domain-containing protein